jgi:hypothetical protein
MYVKTLLHKLFKIMSQQESSLHYQKYSIHVNKYKSQSDNTEKHMTKYIHSVQELFVDGHTYKADNLNL